jgi:bifunctional DNA-binding transcriptional regulator/antitoxin component of YhaV-PrlF toxin-antitoxin module
MTFATVTGEGQATIPMALRELEGIEIGAKSEVFRLLGGSLGAVPLASAVAGRSAEMPAPGGAAGAP